MATLVLLASAKGWAQQAPAPGANTLHQRRSDNEDFRRQLEAASPEERERLIAQRRAEHLGNRPGRQVEVQGPLPLPVQVSNPPEPGSGRPAGAACKPNETCTLELKPRGAETLVVTAVWGAARVQCDDLVTASPANGAPISVAWRCERQLQLQGTGAGYAGYLVAR